MKNSQRWPPRARDAHGTVHLNVCARKGQPYKGVRVKKRQVPLSTHGGYMMKCHCPHRMYANESQRNRHIPITKILNNFFCVANC